MRIGVPKEIKVHEYRVGLTPAGVGALTRAGHELWVQSGAGSAIAFSDEAYQAAGARLVGAAEEVYACPLIVKVKEPQPAEFAFLHAGQVLFAYLHLAADPQLAQALLERQVVGIAYETVRDSRGGLPLLVPMSEVAGRIAVQAGATALQMSNGGRGVLLGGVAGVSPAHVLILGGGIVGTEAARMAIGLGADVTLLDINLDRLRHLDACYGGRLKTRYSTQDVLRELLPHTDLLIGAVLVPGHQAPKLISHEMIRSMPAGAVFVDVAIDQGGCAETSRPTTHDNPTYLAEGVVHYCVGNMPGVCARTATQALSNATLPYVMELAARGWRQVLLDNAGLREGLNVYWGQVTLRSIAEDLGYPYRDALAALTSEIPV